MLTLQPEFEVGLDCKFNPKCLIDSYLLCEIFWLSLRLDIGAQIVHKHDFRRDKFIISR